ncbi:hypothetical protein Tco_1202793 [Tanacetum coccineum]
MISRLALTDALVLMPKFSSTLRTILGIKRNLLKWLQLPMNPASSNFDEFTLVRAGHLNKLPRTLVTPQVPDSFFLGKAFTSRSYSQLAMTPNFRIEQFLFSKPMGMQKTSPLKRSVIVQHKIHSTMILWGHPASEAILEHEPPPHPLPNHKQSYSGEPPEVELKELPPHLISIVGGRQQLPIHYANELWNVEEKSALVKCAKVHKRARRLETFCDTSESINPEFSTHKILMEEDYAPAVQHQRRVTPKIHDVIKKEVEKLLKLID